MNTKTAGNWDTEDRKSLVISPGDHFYIEFILTAAGILVLVNNVLFTTFPHRHNPQTITHLQLEGDAELHEAFFYTKKIAPINHVKQLTDCILLDTKQDSKWLLSRGFKPGSRLVMKGSTKRTACRFSLNLECRNKPVRTIAFHFNPRFSHYQTVMNTMTAGHWDDERHGALTISPGREFCIEFICQREGFKVLVNNEFFTNFSHRHNAQEITHLKLDGDAELRQVCYFPVKNGPFNPVNQFPDSHLLNTSQGCCWILDRGFNTGSRLVMKGSTMHSASRFNLNLECHNRPEPTNAFHFNPRWLEHAIVMNTMTAGHWDEERRGALPISRGNHFSIEFICEDGGFKVLIDDEFFTYFSHRHNPREITHLRLDGDAELHKVFYFPVQDVWA